MRPNLHYMRVIFIRIYGVIAMATGKFPTLIAFPALLAAVWIGVTECEPLTA